MQSFICCKSGTYEYKFKEAFDLVHIMQAIYSPVLIFIHFGLYSTLYLYANRPDSRRTKEWNSLIKYWFLAVGILNNNSLSFCLESLFFFKLSFILLVNCDIFILICTLNFLTLHCRHAIHCPEI